MAFFQSKLPPPDEPEPQYETVQVDEPEPQYETVQVDEPAGPSEAKQYAYEEMLQAKAYYQQVLAQWNAEQARHDALRDYASQQAGRMGAMGMIPGMLDPPPLDTHLQFEVHQAEQQYQMALARYQQTP
jgi:hypothetical protein